MISDVATLAHLCISCLVSSPSTSWVINSGASTHLLIFYLIELLELLSYLFSYHLCVPGPSNEEGDWWGYECDEVYYLQCGDNNSVGIATTISESSPFQ